MSNPTTVLSDPTLTTFRNTMFDRVEEDAATGALYQGGLPVFAEGTVLFARLYDGPGPFTTETVMREAPREIYTPVMTSGPPTRPSDDLKLPFMAFERSTYRLSPLFAVMSLTWRSVAEFGIAPLIPDWAVMDAWDSFTFAAIRYDLDQQPKENQ
jgi:hypothetical protein